MPMADSLPSVRSFGGGKWRQGRDNYSTRQVGAEDSSGVNTARFRARLASFCECTYLHSSHGVSFL